ncbi:MAG TPA: chemotaxis protein CheW [Gammaproteobacteria bacterium]
MNTAQDLHRQQTAAGQYLTFLLAGEEYAVDILRVQEIKGWTRATPIPNTPAYIKGVINLRGTIVPIVDLREHFGLPVVEYGPTTVIIVLRIECADRQRIVGIVVDAVSEVYDLADDSLQAPPDFGSAVYVEFMRGMATVDAKMLIVLDIDHLINTGLLDVLDAGARISGTQD